MSTVVLGIVLFQAVMLVAIVGRARKISTAARHRESAFQMSYQGYQRAQRGQ